MAFSVVVLMRSRAWKERSSRLQLKTRPMDERITALWVWLSCRRTFFFHPVNLKHSQCAFLIYRVNHPVLRLARWAVPDWVHNTFNGNDEINNYDEYPSVQAGLMWALVDFPLKDFSRFTERKKSLFTLIIFFSLSRPHVGVHLKHMQTLPAHTKIHLVLYEEDPVSWRAPKLNWC